MFDHLSAQAWVLAFIGLSAIAPAGYVYRYLSHSPSDEDITRAPEDLSWRNPRRLAGSLIVLGTLAAIAVVAFAPAATGLRRYPIFLPIVAGVVPACLLIAVLVAGSGSRALDTRTRARASYRFAKPRIALMGTVMALAAAIGAFHAYSQQPIKAGHRCFERGGHYSAQTELIACDELIAMSAGRRPYQLADLYAARGYAHQRLGDDDDALGDYSEAIRQDPRYPYPYVGRGLIRLNRSENHLAIADFSAAIAREPGNTEALHGRGLAYQQAGDFPNAAADFSELIRLAPNDAEAYAVRGAAYRSLGDETGAKRDFATAMLLDPQLAKAGPPAN